MCITYIHLNFGFIQPSLRGLTHWLTYVSMAAKSFDFFFTCRVLLLYTSVFFGTNFHLSNVASRYVVLDIRPNYLVLLDRKR